MKLRIGIDFDNTIVSYDDVFYRHALKRGLIRRETPVKKNDVRNAIRRIHGNDAWTELQAYVYSEGMSEAKTFDGTDAFLNWTKRQGVPAFVISHKTSFAAIGSGINLHQHANSWLDKHDFFSRHLNQVNRDEHIFFEETRAAKLARIEACRCTHFIDDLPELLTDEHFPKDVERIWFDANGQDNEKYGLKHFKDWKAIKRYFISIIEL